MNDIKIIEQTIEELMLINAMIEWELPINYQITIINASRYLSELKDIKQKGQRKE